MYKLIYLVRLASIVLPPIGGSRFCKEIPAPQVFENSPNAEGRDGRVWTSSFLFHSCFLPPGQEARGALLLRVHPPPKNDIYYIDN